MLVMILLFSVMRGIVSEVGTDQVSAGMPGDRALWLNPKEPQVSAYQIHVLETCTRSRWRHSGPMTLSKLVTLTKVQPSKARCLHQIAHRLLHSGLFELHEELGAEDSLPNEAADNVRRAAVAGNKPQLL